jgi:hypothetical protein
MLVDSFVANINKYRSRLFYPSKHLKADETITRWYGVGGVFVDAGLPMYLVLERKLDNGSKIQNLADIASRIMLRLKVVKSTNEEKAIATATATGTDNDDDAANEGGKGTQVILELTEPWHHSDRLVTTDAYFAFVEAAFMLKEKDLIFIGNVKQCSRRFPMEVLGNTTLPKQGLQSVLAWIGYDTGKT